MAAVTVCRPAGDCACCFVQRILLCREDVSEQRCLKMDDIVGEVSCGLCIVISV
eukprot:COSAG01_NODE_3963_length_5491_cov_83.216617_10_plen_54_part_00